MQAQGECGCRNVECVNLEQRTEQNSVALGWQANKSPGDPDKTQILTREAWVGPGHLHF